MGYLGVPALHALVEADSQAKVIFYSRPRLMLLSALRNCSMALQIEQLALAVTYVRSRPGKNWALECLRQLVHSKMNDDSVRLSLEASISSEKSDPRALFEDSANVHRQVAQAEVSLVKVQLPKTADRIRRAVDREDLGWPIHCPREGKLEKPPSPTELHRIRRALWRLWLYFDIFHDPRRNKVYLSHHQNLVAQYSFFSQLTIWELEEIDCVYYHLQHQNQCLWRRQCTICSQQVLPDVIFNGICKECRRDKETNVRMTEKEREDDPDTASFSYARSWSREHMYRREPVVEWTDSATANRPNAGFQHLAKSSDREHVTNTYRHDASLGCFLDWGYCMWDESRFRAWHLVDNADTKPQKDEADIEKLDKSPSEPKLPIDRNKRAVKGWWTDKVRRYDFCAHCRCLC